MTDPYKILGVSPSATDEEVKKAYRALAVKYHPDNYVNNPLADLAEEKMKEINEAYDTIQKQRAAGGSSSSYSGSYSNSYSDFSGFGSSSSSGSSDFAEVRRRINMNDVSGAESMLRATSSDKRNAEWNYLMGCLFIKKGNYFDAQRYLETACYMDPNNVEYRNMRDNLRRSTQRTSNPYGYSTGTGDCDACDICSALMCLNCLCGGRGGGC